MTRGVKKLIKDNRILISVFAGLTIVMVTLLVMSKPVAWKKASYPHVNNDMRKAMQKATPLDFAMEMLATDDEQAFEQAIYQLEVIGEKARPLLLKKIASEGRKNKKLRNNIIYTYGRLGEKARDDVLFLQGYLRHEDPETRSVAVSALGKIGAESSVRSMAVLLKDEDVLVRSAARRALERMNSPSARRVLR